MKGYVLAVNILLIEVLVYAREKKINKVAAMASAPKRGIS